MLRRDFAKALIGAGVAVAAPPAKSAGAIMGEEGPEIVGLPRGSDEQVTLDDAQRLTVRPGDVIVLSTEMHISCDTAERIRERFAGVFPDHKVLVLSGGLKLGVVGSDA